MIVTSEPLIVYSKSPYLFVFSSAAAGTVITILVKAVIPAIAAHISLFIAFSSYYTEFDTMIINTINTASAIAFVIK